METPISLNKHPEWIPASGPPNPEEEALIVTEPSPGKFATVTGFHLPKHHRNTDDEEFDGDCDSEGGKSYWPEGWYETHLYGSEDYQTWQINDPVVAWMELPRYQQWIYQDTSAVDPSAQDRASLAPEIIQRCAVCHGPWAVAAGRCLACNPVLCARCESHEMNPAVKHDAFCAYMIDNCPCGNPLESEVREFSVYELEKATPLCRECIWVDDQEHNQAMQEAYR